MRELQEKVLNRNIDSLSVILQRAERRCARYANDNLADLEVPRTLDLAFVERLAVSLHQLKKFQREHGFNESREEMMACLKDAITQLHELCGFTRGEIDSLDEFQSKLFEREERWVRMLNISLIGLFVNICADHIRISMESIDRKMHKLSDLNRDASVKTSKKPHLYIVK